MARFMLKPSKREAQIGNEILKLAETIAYPKNKPARLSAKNAATFKKNMKAMISRSSRIKKINIVLDTPDTLNIVIPYFPNIPDYKNPLAKEILGLVVIRGCGK